MCSQDDDPFNNNATQQLTSCVLENDKLLFTILNFCDEGSRFNCILLSTKHTKILTSDAAFRWRLECLHRERGVYHSLVTCNSSSITSSWKDMFIHNYDRRNLWSPDSNNNNNKKKNDNRIDSEHENHKFHIQVSARFRPKNDHADANLNHYHHEKKIALPLYQRLALIKMNRNLQTKKEAFRVLCEQGDWFGKERRDDDTEAEEEVMNDSANKKSTLRGGVHFVDTKNNFAVLVDPIKGLRKFEFDNVFHDSFSQERVYNATTMPLIAEFINGYNVSCLVYGQTGSGKTHTMYGATDFKLNHQDISNFQLPTAWGIVPRACKEIFEAIKFRRNNINISIEAKLAVSYVEIFGDSVTDLLRGGKSCGQSKVAAQRYVLDGSSEVDIHSIYDVLSLLNEGEKQKRKAATAMNKRSSRAHSLFIVRMKQTCVNTGLSYTSRLFLADLGGSEQLKKSQSFAPDNKKQSEHDLKQRAREAVNINLGLLALKQCVEALRKKSSFIPYTDSKLTSMLSTGLGGDSKTAVIVCGAQEQIHGNETIAAMKFGQTCKGISNSAKVSTGMLEDLLQNINDQIKECEENIKKNERWETRQVKNYDENGKVTDIRTITVVTGAEEYREKLSTLIQQKLDLTGDNTDSLYSEANEIEGFGNAHVYGLGNKVRRDSTV